MLVLSAKSARVQWGLQGLCWLRWQPRLDSLGYDGIQGRLPNWPIARLPVSRGLYTALATHGVVAQPRRAA
jgi:hypothetical protein